MTAPAILSYGRPRRRLARVPLLFRARDCEDEDGIFALSYGKRVGLVHTRTGANGLATMSDENGRLVRVPADWPRLSWEMTSSGSRVRTLLGEGQRINIGPRSQEFNLWSIQSGASVTPNTVIAPDGTLTGDTITGGGVVESGVYIVPVFTDGEGSWAIYLQAGTATRTDLLIYDTVSAPGRRRLVATWTAGVPSVEGTLGTGRVYAVERVGTTRWYRIAFTNDAIVGANPTRVYVYPHNEAPYTGTVHAWGSQPENAIIPSSYIPTAGATVTRAADVMYWPVAFAPQELTAYVRGVERGVYTHAISDERRLLHIGSSNIGADARFSMGKVVTSNHPFGQYDDGATAVVSGSASPIAPVVGDTIEHRMALSDDWKVTSGFSLNGAAETVAAQTSASGSAASWAAGVNRVYLTGGLNASNGLFGYQSVVLDYGTRERDELRELVEVA